METLVVSSVAAAAAFLAFLSIVRRLRTNSGPPRRSYSPVPLFSQGELAFLACLDRVASGRWRVMGKVRVADLLSVVGDRDSSSGISAFRAISQKHVDFVLVSPDGAIAMAAIELDDSSHGRADRSRRDAFLDAAFADAGVPLVRIKARARYSDADVLSAISSAIDGRA